MDGDPITFRALLEEDEAEHRAPCTRCGQLIDRRELVEIFHHRLPEHQPLPAH
ncbi:MAG: hypothetical protein H7124_00800 [Phycisphaerales bacterium]|nr:hypothetical protein [Hyphomonadaceae bacterium]